jgi:putative PIN family toxin of toxin-antitoxin system
MIRAVLDTNVVVSAVLKAEGAPALILDMAISKFFRCYVSEQLLQEYGEVLGRPRFALDSHQTARFLNSLRRTASFVIPRRRLRVTADPDDNRVLECALEARADYVVTGNIRHFPARFQDVRIIRPRQFLTVLATQPI